jgi:hypothetical protein
METEHFLTGYCRAQDQSRMVAVVLESGRLEEADCDYGSCPYMASCQIAQKIRELTAP